MRGRLGVRGKLFAVSLGLIATVGIATGSYLEHRVRAELTSQIRGELDAHVSLARIAVEHADGGEGLDAMADRLGRSLGAHVSIASRDGRLRGDSEIDAADIASAPSLELKAEVQRALRDGRGTAERYSTQRNARVIYAAVTYPEHGAATGIVRVGLPLDRIDTAISRLRAWMGMATLLGLVIAVLMSALASQLMTRQLRALVKQAKRVSKGKDSRVALSSGDELDKLATSFNRVSRHLLKTGVKLQRERLRLQAVLDTMAEGVVVLDETSHVKLCNPAAMALLCATENPVDRRLIEVARAPALTGLVKRSLAGEAAFGELELGSKPPRLVLARAAPLGDNSGVVIVLHDVSDMRRLETVRRDFVANLSHELRTPISVIAANAETLKRGALDEPENAHAFVYAISRNAERLGRLIADLLDLSRVEAGRYPISVQAVKVLHAAEQALQGLRDAVRAKEIDVSIEVAADVAVAADGPALEHVLVNLLDNAVKYAKLRGRVCVRAHSDGDRVRIEVQDDGPGIAPAHRERIFERFYRVDAGRSRALGGTGLGLSIVKHLCEQMRGAVGVEPAPQRGSLFWIELPSATGSIVP